MQNNNIADLRSMGFRNEFTDDNTMTEESLNSDRTYDDTTSLPTYFRNDRDLQRIVNWSNMNPGVGGSSKNLSPKRFSDRRIKARIAKKTKKQNRKR